MTCAATSGYSPVFAGGRHRSSDSSCMWRDLRSFASRPYRGPKKNAHRKTLKSVPNAPQRSAPGAVTPVAKGHTERGIASWYGDPYHGRRAANGEVFDMNEMTAAHRTMPFGTWVKVDNETNGKHVNVRITDRGPFVADRIIDLSRGAAEEIAMLRAGIVMVKLTVIDPPKGAVVERYGVQVAAWEDRAKAEVLRKEIGAGIAKARIVERKGDPTLFRVIVGEGTREEAEEQRRRLRNSGYRGFVTRIDLNERVP